MHSHTTANDFDFEQAFEQASIALAVGTPDRIVRANRAMGVFLGRPEVDLPGCRWVELTHPHDRAAGRLMIERVAQGQIDNYGLDERFLRGSGEVVWGHLTVTSFPGPQSEEHQVLVQVQDISSRVEAEERLGAASAQLAEAQALAHIGSWEYEVESESVSWSPEMRRLSDFDGHIDSARIERELFPSEDLEQIRVVVRDALRSKRPFVVQHHIARPDGEIRDVVTRGRIVTDAAEKPVRVVGTMQDITELLQLETLAAEVESLRSRQQRALEIHDNVVQGLAVAKLALEMKDASRAARAIKSTLTAAQDIVARLMTEAPVEAGDLVRRRPAVIERPDAP